MAVTVRTSEQVCPEYCLNRTATVCGDLAHISSISFTARCRWASSSWLKLNWPLAWSHLNLRFFSISARIWELSSTGGSVVEIELNIGNLSVFWSLQSTCYLKNLILQNIGTFLKQRILEANMLLCNILNSLSQGPTVFTSAADLYGLYSIILSLFSFIGYE